MARENEQYNNFGQLTPNGGFDANGSVIGPGNFYFKAGTTTPATPTPVPQNPYVSVPYRTPPAAPNLSALTNTQNKIMAQRNSQIAAAMKEYDALEASTRASGFQAADNAGSVYAQRLIQQGINPSASGVVAAQARLPVYNTIHEITTDREKTRLDASSRADSLAAQLASTTEQIKLGYANLLADYNIKQTGLEVDASKFNASMFDQQAAEVAGNSRRNGNGTNNSEGDGRYITPDFTPGYVTNSGPIIPATGGYYTPRSGAQRSNGKNVFGMWPNDATGPFPYGSI